MTFPPSDSSGQEYELLLADLARNGYPLLEVYELKKTLEKGERYNAAIPILTKWLPIVHDMRKKEAIVRALSVPWAKSATPTLLEEFTKLHSDDGGMTSHLKWAIGSAIEMLADQRIIEQVLSIVADRSHKRDREMIVLALGKMKDQRAADAARELLSDEDVNGHALIALRKLKAMDARPEIEKLIDHPNEWKRSEAKKTLASFDRLERD